MVYVGGMAKINSASQHIGDQRIRRHLIDLCCADVAAVAQNRDAIDKSEQLIEPMADIDDAGARCTQLAQDVEQVSGVGLGNDAVGSSSTSTLALCASARTIPNTAFPAASRTPTCTRGSGGATSMSR